MLSRRNARVKVMQMLYASNRDNELTLDESKRQYWNKIYQSKELLLFSLYTLVQVTKISKSDFTKRQKKYLPSQEDKKFVPKLFENRIIESIDKDPRINALNKKFHFGEKIDNDLIQGIYYEFAKTDAYKSFIIEDEAENSVLNILLELFRFCRANDNFIEIIEDQYINWYDDKSIIIGTIKKVLKNLNKSNLIDIDSYDSDSETVKEFGETLLIRTFKDNDSLLEKIQPVLKNWDSDRVAIIDLILLKMALSELLAFETIPTKVTLNEYVELAKLYSTPKSKEFVNGILDTLVDSLMKSEEIVKKGRGLVD